MERYGFDITQMLLACAKDISSAGPLDADALARAYDLLDALMEISEDLPADEDFGKAVRTYTECYERGSGSLGERIDMQRIKDEILRDLKEHDAAVHEARFKAAAATSLHEFAKEVFETWQTAGIFARRRALRELRARAGFRLESHRIGNYVAKTFDLMNEAQGAFAKAQQARFSADTSYKIKPDTYDGIYNILHKTAQA